MGAHDVGQTFEAANEKAALKKAKEIMENARHEGGHEAYAGHIGTAHGVKVHRMTKLILAGQADDLLFGTEKTDFEGIAKKHGPAILMQVRNTGSRRRLWLLAALVAS